MINEMALQKATDAIADYLNGGERYSIDDYYMYRMWALVAIKAYDKSILLDKGKDWIDDTIKH